MSTEAFQMSAARMREAATPRRFRAEVARDAAAFRSGWGGGGTPFQSAIWLASWYEALSARPDVEPLVVTVRDAASGETALRVPLVLRRADGLRVVEFADLGLTDYNAPLLGPAAPRGRVEGRRAIRALRRVLPGADLLRLAKMPDRIGGRENPLAALPGAVPCALNGNVVETGEDLAAWRRSLGRHYRKELDRSWRVFARGEGAAFARVTDPAPAGEVMAVLEAQQGERMREIGKPYMLGAPDVSRFYRTMVERGVADGSVVVTTLRADGEPVASLVGLRQGETFVMIRISSAGGRWSNCSPGRLVIERTIALLHEEGCRHFDFSIGNYDYKRRFDTRRLPLVDYVAPLGWRGVPAALRARIVGRLREHPKLDARLRRLFGHGDA